MRLIHIDNAVGPIVEKWSEKVEPILYFSMQPINLEWKLPHYALNTLDNLGGILKMPKCKFCGHTAKQHVDDYGCRTCGCPAKREIIEKVEGLQD